MTDHVYRKFPSYIKTIQAILQQDATFREICDEYEEMCTWLACQYHSETRQSKEYDHARKMIWNLEDEIKKALRDHGF